VHSGFLRFLVRRAALAVLLVLVVSSAAFLLAQLAPGDHLDDFGMDPEAVAAERRRLGLDRPIGEQYAEWLRDLLRLDFGESIRFRRPVAGLVRDAAANTAVLGVSALLLATAAGLPLGIYSGSRRGGMAAIVRGVCVFLISVPPLITSMAFLLLAARTGWFPLGGMGPLTSDSGEATLAVRLHHLVLPTLALALPVSAALERIQSRATSEALAEPPVMAARGRGLSRRQIVWRHALRLSLKPVLAVYGIMIGGLLSGSFAVEILMSWPGLGQLLYRAFTARDTFLIAGCAIAASVFLAIGILVSDIALALSDPRVEADA
jgi:peptide/nickel transport system permease protein